MRFGPGDRHESFSLEEFTESLRNQLLAGGRNVGIALETRAHASVLRWPRG